MNGAVAARIFVLAAMPALCSGCQDLSTGCCAAGRVISQEVLDNDTFLATIDRSADDAWRSTKVALKRTSPTTIDLHDAARSAVVEIDLGYVIAEVKTYAPYSSTLRVSATGFGEHDGELARKVYDRILHEIEK